MLIVCSDLCCSGQALHQQRQFAVLLAYFLWCIRFKCALCAAIWCESYIHLLPSAATQPNPWKTEKASKGKAMVGRSVGWWAVGVGWWDEWLCLLLLFVCCAPVSLIRIDILSPSPVPPPFSLSLFNFSLWFSLVFVGEQTSHTHTNATRWTSTSTTPTQFLRCRSSSRFAPRFRSPVSMRDPNEHRLFPIISYALVALFHSHTRTHTHSLTLTLTHSHSHSLTHTHTHTHTLTHSHPPPPSSLTRALRRPSPRIFCACACQATRQSTASPWPPPPPPSAPLLLASSCWPQALARSAARKHPQLSSKPRTRAHARYALAALVMLACMRSCCVCVCVFLFASCL